MKILFVYSVNDILSPDRPLRTQEEIQFGISYMSSILKKNGYATDLLVLSRMLGGKNKKTAARCIDNFNPDIICFTAVSTEYSFILDIAGFIRKRYPDKYMLIGGSHISLNPDDIVWNNFDALCIGEGEYPLFELVLQLEKGKTPTEIQNLWIKNNSKLEKNSLRPFLKNLDSLPFPDREIWQEWIGDLPESRHPVLLGRGCPFQCTYCCNHALRELTEGSYVRLRSPESVVEELKEIIKKFPQDRKIYLEVETIGQNREWALNLCSELEELNRTLDTPLDFGTNLRVTPQTDFEELFRAFERSNFTFINIGLESGSERIRKDVLKRNYSNEDVERTVNQARQYGLKVNFFNLIGIPGETMDDFKETVKINQICMPDKNLAHIFFPYPGTELHKFCKENGFLKKELDPRSERRKAVLDLPGFSKKQIRKSFVWFDYYIYKGQKPLYSLLIKVLISKFRSVPLLHHIYRRLTYSVFFRWTRYLEKRDVPSETVLEKKALVR